jgi:hypothetical protein
VTALTVKHVPLTLEPLQRLELPRSAVFLGVVEEEDARGAMRGPALVALMDEADAAATRQVIALLAGQTFDGTGCRYIGTWSPGTGPEGPRHFFERV